MTADENPFQIQIHNALPDSSMIAIPNLPEPPNPETFSKACKAGEHLQCAQAVGAALVTVCGCMCHKVIVLNL